MAATNLAYEALAAELEAQIRRGTLRPGDRLPSVRRTSVEQRRSLSTVLEAYRRLEMLRLIEARPRSGYYVLPQVVERPPLPLGSPASPAPTSVGTAGLIAQVVRAVADPDAVPLGAALPDASLLPHAALKRCMTAAMRFDAPGGVAQVPPEGVESLRREIARREWSAGHVAYHDEILVTAGASEALDVALRATTSPGDIVAVESPAFFGVLQAIETLGRRALEIPVCAEEGIDIDALEAAIAKHPVRALIVTPNFHNPVGSYMPDASRARLVALMTEHGIPVIEDDTFGELYFEGPQPRSLRAWDEAGWVIRCGSFSKTLAPGYRIGWIVPGPRHFEAVRRCKLATSLGTSAPPQLALARYLAAGGYDRHLRRLRRTLRNNVARLSAEVCSRFPEGTRIGRPRGGFVLWIELPAGADALALGGRALAAGISICPGPIFSPSGGYRNCIRLSAGHPWSERTEGAVEKLGRMLMAPMNHGLNLGG